MLFHDVCYMVIPFWLMLIETRNREISRNYRFIFSSLDMAIKSQRRYRLIIAGDERPWMRMVWIGHNERNEASMQEHNEMISVRFISLQNISKTLLCNGQDMHCETSQLKLQGSNIWYWSNAMIYEYHFFYSSLHAISCIEVMIILTFYLFSRCMAGIYGEYCCDEAW